MRATVLTIRTTKFEFESENEVNSVSNRQMTPSSKWPIPVITESCLLSRTTVRETVSLD